MGTRVEVHPGRINCPTCHATPGNPCTAMTLSENGLEIVPKVPAKILDDYHPAREHAARDGWV